MTIIKALESVTKRLCGKELERVPSDRWVANILNEANTILNRQLVTKMQTDDHLCITTDTATHNNVSFVGTQLHCSDGTNYTLGIFFSILNFFELELHYRIGLICNCSSLPHQATPNPRPNRS